jgi:hypothetical protein
MIYRMRSYFGGVGDEAQFSTLPEYLTSLGHEVYMLDDPMNVQVKPFRNPDIKKLFYDCNPFIKGEKKGHWNLGDLMSVRYANRSEDFIKNWEIAFGLEPQNSYPKIYYSPVKHNDIHGLIELSSITLTYSSEAVIEAVKNIMSDYQNITFKQVVNQFQSKQILVPGIETIESSDIFGMIDLIYSCSVFISLNSGSHMLGGCIRWLGNNFDQYCFLPASEQEWILKDKKFILPNVKYVIT